MKKPHGYRRAWNGGSREEAMRLADRRTALVHWSRSQRYFQYGLYQYVPEQATDAFCWLCRKPARTIDWSFECWVCSPECTEIMWDEYQKACGYGP
jgi:hypothetical protein